MTTNTTTATTPTALARQPRPPHRCRAGWLPPLPDGTAVPCLVCKPHLRPDDDQEPTPADDGPMRRDRDGDLVPADAPAAAELIRAQLREQYARPLPVVAHTCVCRTCGRPLPDAVPGVTDSALPDVTP